ncbi:MAG: iron uptake porin [Xenococcus sp. MO_188.B8]|nr:iron uptake porin [Xenococcus sp. MO_188.B8]
MHKLLRYLLLVSPAISLIAVELSSIPAQAETLITQDIAEDLDLVPLLDNFSQDNPEDPFNQVTNVNQLRDVAPSDWAYEALRSLVDRYGCIVGYPDQTYRGNQALSRYEFAAGLNACLKQIERLIAASEAVLQEDLETINRLMQEFEAELASVKGRVDNLESRTAFLEDHQFSTTTRLQGSVVFALADLFGGDGGKNQTVFQERTTLTLGTSFTGKDLLLTSLWQGNSPLNVGFDQAGTQAGGVNVPSAEGTLSSQFGANTDGDVKLLFLSYQFPVGERLKFNVSQGFDIFHSTIPTLNPYLDDLDLGRGAISVFGQRSPIYSTGGGSGVTANYQITDGLLLSTGYLAGGLSAPDPNEGAGLFDGSYAALGQLTWKISEKFSLAGGYTNSYAPPGNFGVNYNGLLVSGTAVANTLAGQVSIAGVNPDLQQNPVVINAYSAQFSWQPNPKFALSGWFTASYPRLIGRGDGEILSYALTFAFPDLGSEGNLLGFVLGAEPYLTSFSGGNPQPFKVDLPLHIEAFYRYQVNDNISITPGFIWLTAPNQDNNNDDNVIATIRTTFQF